jgi:hypothetical protein
MGGFQHIKIDKVDIKEKSIHIKAHSLRKVSRAEIDAFKKAMKSLSVLDLKIDGVVVNGSDPRPKGYYKSKYSYYRYGKSYY